MQEYRLTVKMIAEDAGVHERTVRRWIKAGRLKAVRWANGNIKVSAISYSHFKGLQEIVQEKNSMTDYDRL